MLWTTAAQSVSKNMTWTSVRIRGEFGFNIGQSPFPMRELKQVVAGIGDLGLLPHRRHRSGLQHRLRRCFASTRPLCRPLKLHRDSVDNFLYPDSVHAAEIDRAFAEKARTAF